MVIFDEFPLGALLDRQGNIHAERFPGFGRLSERSTWYPNATTPSPSTVFAVPATLTGTYSREEIDKVWPPGEWDVPPVASRYPQSLFTMLAASHELNVFEWVTQVCPRDLCEADATAEREASGHEPLMSLVRDLAVVAQYRLLPAQLAEQRFPDIAGQWADLAEHEEHVATGAAAAEDHMEGERPSGDRFEAMLPTVRASSSPQLWFAHERLPHRPTSYLRDGTRYPRHFRFDYHVNHRGMATLPYRQQYLLQVQHVDLMVDRLLDGLEAEGLLEDSLVIITSDHGLSYQPGGHARGRDRSDMTDEILSDVLPIPLFIKYPGQDAGTIDRRQAQLTDLMPTIVDVLDISLPSEWRFDGRSLLDDTAIEWPLFWQPVGGELDPGAYNIDPMQLARQHLDLFGASVGAHDLYAMGPFRHLIGEQAPPSPVGRAENSSVAPIGSEAYRKVSPSSGVVPALFEATVEGLEPGTWVAVALNGRLAGTGPVISGRDGEPRLKVMLDPGFFRQGENDVAVYLVEDGETLRSVPLDD
jgi:hypothetical protein